MKLERILTKEIEKVILCYVYTQNLFLSFYLFLLFHNAAIMNERIEIEALTMNEIIE